MGNCHRMINYLDKKMSPGKVSDGKKSAVSWEKVGWDSVGGKIYAVELEIVLET